MTGKLILFRGLPGSGKTYQAKEIVQKELAAGRKAINLDRDQIRLANGFGVAPTGDFENVITEMQRAQIKHGLRKGWTVIESSTNLRSSNLKQLIELGEHYGAGVEVIDVDTPIELCIERDEARKLEGGHYVGEKAIRDIAARFLSKGKFSAVPKLKPAATAEPYVADIDKPKAILVDIDGTVAEIDGRSPFTYTLVSTDKPKKWVIDRVRDAYKHGIHIIFMSGRPDSCFADTEKWIDRQVGISYFDLFMRPAGDGRQDAVVKLELFDKHVRHNYNVLYCLDDRKQVIEAYRSIGLNVLDVAGHDF